VLFRPKRAAYGVAGLRSGSGQRDARRALMAKPLASKPRPKLFHLTYTNRYVCPDGKLLHPQGRRQKRPGLIYHRYEARRRIVKVAFASRRVVQTTRKRGRSVARPEESTIVIAFRKKMASEEAQAQYRCRGRVVEFCHAWIKSKLGLRQFDVRGLLKVQMEMLWACLTYNLQHWDALKKSRDRHRKLREAQEQTLGDQPQPSIKTRSLSP
jgi:hypothetical protein